jgi:hypothetical protein
MQIFRPIARRHLDWGNGLLGYQPIKSLTWVVDLPYTSASVIGRSLKYGLRCAEGIRSHRLPDGARLSPQVSRHGVPPNVDPLHPRPTWQRLV